MMQYRQTLIEELLPIATLVTPNIPEAEILSGLKIENKEEMLTAARKISGIPLFCSSERWSQHQ